MGVLEPENYSVSARSQHRTRVNRIVLPPRVGIGPTAVTAGDLAMGGFPKGVGTGVRMMTAAA